jgi:hypothetical protein
MTTFTSDDREEEYKKIVEAAPYQPGYEDAVPMASPPHIVDSGASVMVRELTDDEIMALWKPMPDTKVYVRDLYAFARAILRKAQEK